MKKAIVIILAVAFIALNIGANNGLRVVKVTPLNYVQKIYENLPGHFDLVADFTEYYGEGETVSWKDRLLWFSENLWNAASFPVKAAVWCINVLVVVIGTIPELIQFDLSGIVSGEGVTE